MTNKTDSAMNTIQEMGRAKNNQAKASTPVLILEIEKFKNIPKYHEKQTCDYGQPSQYITINLQVE